MATAEGFLEAIIARPDDDGPRLAYADWLDERGDAARAELIRVQIALARLPEYDGRRAALERRSVVLQNQYVERWVGVPTPSLAVFGVLFDKTWVFRRGMLEGYNGHTLDFFHVAGKLFREWPLSEVGLDGFTKISCRTLLSAPWLDRVRSLSLGQDYAKIGEGDLATLFAAPSLSHLTALGLEGRGMGPKAIRALVRSRRLKGLRALHLYGARVGANGAATLADWEGLSRLAALSLTQEGGGPEALRTLLASRLLGRLDRLDVRDNGFGAEGAVAVAEARALTSLRDLDLSGNAVGDPGVEALTASPCLKSLEKLNLSENRTGDRGAAALAAWPGLARVSRLDLAANSLGDDGARALAASPHGAALRELDLRGNRLSRRGAAALASAGLFSKKAGSYNSPYSRKDNLPPAGREPGTRRRRPDGQGGPS